MTSISIIMPSFNSEEYISETINSIISQTFKDWELIIVDDYSKDKTIKIIKEYTEKDNRISLIKLESNFGGPAKPRNIGIKKSKSDVIAFCDSDDVWHKKKLEIQFDVLKKNEAVLVATKSKNFKNLENLYFKKINTEFIALNKKRILYRNGILNSSVLVLKRAILACGKFSEDSDLIAVEDYDMWLKISKLNEKMILLKSELTGYRVLENSLSNKKIKRIKKFILIYKNYHYDDDRKFIKFLTYFNLIIFSFFWIIGKTK
tara:strand:- start:8017 stop:8799 length:783 start_codon:yes stop_codon:yes gene_type:complete